MKYCHVTHSHVSGHSSAAFAAFFAALAPLALLAAKGTCTNVVVPELTDAHWNQQISPFNDYSPYGMAGGCVAVSVSQELRYWQWPWRLEGVRETSHIVVGHDRSVIRFDGSEPFRWDLMQARYTSSDSLSSRHEAARLMLACQSLVQMQFLSVGASANKSVGGALEWFEYGGCVNPAQNGGDESAIAAIRADMEWGSPVQVGINVEGYGGHEVFGLGFAEGTDTAGDETSLMYLNYGWGGSSDGWYDLKDATHFKGVHVGFRPLKTVQIEPVPPVSGDSVSIAWHLPNCYTNRIDGFSVSKSRLSQETGTFSDDFSASAGRSSNTNELRIVDGALRAWDATATALWTYDEKFQPTEDSVLTYDVGSAYMASMSVRFEMKFDNGGWETVHEVNLEGGSSAYYNYGTMTRGVSVPLGQFAGKCAQLRLAVEYISGGIFPYADAHVNIDNLSVSAVRRFEPDGDAALAAAGARGATFENLEDGETYAFTVAPVMSNGDASVPQSVTTTIGTPAPAPAAIAAESVVDCMEMIQEGFYLECGEGTTSLAVHVPNATSLEALPSHLTFLPDSAVAVRSAGDGEWTVEIDGSQPVSMREGTKTILTLRAKNGDGASVSKDMELCFRSGLTMGAHTYNVVRSGDADAPVSFAGGTTIDGRGYTLTVKEGAFTGSGDVTLADGTFIFEGLGSFDGTIAVDATASASLAAGSFGTIAGSGALTVASATSVDDYSAWNGTLTVASGATLTVPADGIGTTEVEAGGTLKVVLSDAQIAYGFSTDRIVSSSGTVLFVDSSGATVAANTSSIESRANTWTGEDIFFGENYTDKWSGGLPSDGDFVKFLVADSDGATMLLNLSGDTTLGYIYATGTAPLEITKLANASTALLTAEVFENDVEVKITTDRFAPGVIIPSANLVLSKNVSVGCELDGSRADYVKTYYGGSTLQSALPHGDIWHGTVVFSGTLPATFNPNSYGNANSTVKLAGANGYFSYNTTFTVPVVLADDGDTPALNWSNGSSTSTAVFSSLLGDGTFKTTSPAAGGGEKILLSDVSGFTGSFDLSSKTVAIGGSQMPSADTSSYGRLHVCTSASVHGGSAWKIADGVYLADGAALTVAGTLDTTCIRARGAGASFVLEDGGLIEVDAIQTGETVPSFNLRAGTFRITSDASADGGFAFSAPDGSETTLDVNGRALVFAAGAVSGTGTVHPTSLNADSSQQRGSVTFAGLDGFTGSIVIDGTTQVNLPEDLAAFFAAGGGIVLVGTEMTLPAATAAAFANGGGVDVRDGATLFLEIDAMTAATGISVDADAVALSGSGTLAFKSASGGDVLAVLGPGDLRDGAYTLPPQSVVVYDSSLTASFMQDSSRWNGTVWIKNNQSLAYFASDNYGNASSTVRLTSCTGHFNGPTCENTVKIELVDEDGAPALNLNNGWSAGTPYIAVLSGDGTLATSGTSTSIKEKLFIHDISQFAGSLDLSAKNVIVGTETPSSDISDDGRLFVCAGECAAVAEGRTWTVNGGAFVAGALIVRGRIDGDIVLREGGTLIMGENGSVGGAVTGTVSGYEENGTIVLTNLAQGAFTVPAQTPVAIRHGADDITGAFAIAREGAALTLALDPAGSVQGVSVEPEIDCEAPVPFTVDGSEARISVRAISGLWYSVESGTSVDSGAIGGSVSRTPSSMAPATATIELKAARPSRAAGFYRIVVSPSAD